MGKSNTYFEEISKLLGEVLEEYTGNYYIQIDACNDFVLPMDWDFYNRINPNCHLAYVRRGSGYYDYDTCEKVDTMKQGKLYFFSTGYQHSRMLDKRNLPHMVLLRFNIIHIRTGEPLSFKKPFGFSIQDRQSSYDNMLTNMVQNYDHPTKKYGKRIATSQLEQILYELLESTSSQYLPRTVDKRLRRTIEYMQVNIHQQISIDRLCKIAGLSKNYYRKLFMKEYGLFPKAYMIQMRLEHAEHLLMETEHTIKEIAHNLGYSDPYSFSKQYKEKRGYPPSMYRTHRKFR